MSKMSKMSEIKINKVEASVLDLFKKGYQDLEIISNQALVKKGSIGGIISDLIDKKLLKHEEQEFFGKTYSCFKITALGILSLAYYDIGELENG